MRHLMLGLFVLALTACPNPLEPTPEACAVTGWLESKITTDTLPDGTVEAIMDYEVTGVCDLSEPWCLCLD